MTIDVKLISKSNLLDCDYCGDPAKVKMLDVDCEYTTLCKACALSLTLQLVKVLSEVTNDN